MSLQVLGKAVTHSDNVYKIPNVRIIGKICQTNLTPNTAFRGFGGPEGMFIAEQWMSEVASCLGLPSEQVRELNMYREGDATHYGMVLTDCTIRRCWDTLRTKSFFDQRKIAVDNFNQ